MERGQPPKRGRLAGNRGRGRSGRHSAASASEPQVHNPFSDFFSSTDQSMRYFSEFKSRKILEQKYLDINFFGNENFGFMEHLNNLNLSGFASIGGRIYPDLVRLFYCNLEYDSENNCLISEVKKIPIEIDTILFGSLAHLSLDGLEYEGSLPPDWRSEYKPLETRQLICREGVTNFSHISAGDVSLNHRLLHYFCTYVLNPRDGNHAVFLESDIALIWVLLNEKPVNWVHYIQKRMLSARSKNAPLPFPALITKILQEFSVPVEDEYFEDVKLSHVIGEKNVYTMGYSKDPNGVWVFNPNAPKNKKSSSASSSSAQPAPTSLDDILTGIQNLQTYVGGRMDRMDRNFEQLNYRVSYVEGNIADLRTHMGFPAYTHPVPPPLDDSDNDGAPQDP